MPAATATASTRDRLVDTARAYLDAEGVEGIGLREIARRAGVSHGAPLRHFPTLGVFALMFRSDLCDVGDADYLTTGGIAFGQLVGLVADAQAAGLRPDAPAPELA